MASHPVLYLYLWFAPHALQLVLAVMMVRQKLAKEFPAFFLYTVNEVMQFVILFTFYRLPSISDWQYTVAWFALNSISVCLRFAIIHEVFRHVFEGYPTLKDFGNVLFRWSTVVLMIVAVTLVAYFPGNETDRLTLAYTAVDRTVSAVQCGLLVLILVLSRFFGLPWRSHAFGIMLGLGFFASTELGIVALRAQWALEVASDFFGLLIMATYHCCVLFWMVTLLMPEPQETRVTSLPAHDLDHWNDALQRLLQQ
jgi:hypothetical protein